jgi:hypothetical protein
MGCSCHMGAANNQSELILGKGLQGVLAHK